MQKVIKLIEKEKLIVIVRGVEREKLLPLTKAMYEGGVRFLELTYIADGAVYDEQSAENIKMLVEHFGKKMYFGAGTVITEKQVELTKQAGGSFIISPSVDVDVIKKTKELHMISMPGAITPSEIQTAHKAGADFIKLFPVSNFGISYIKAIKAPLSHVKFMAVGGIDEDNINDYAKIGVTGFGIGSNIVDKKLIDNNDYAKITELAKRYIEIIKGRRNKE